MQGNNGVLFSHPAGEVFSHESRVTDGSTATHHHQASQAQLTAARSSRLQVGSRSHTVAGATRHALIREPGTPRRSCPDQPPSARFSSPPARPGSVAGFVFFKLGQLRFQRAELFIQLLIPTRNALHNLLVHFRLWQRVLSFGPFHQIPLLAQLSLHNSDMLRWLSCQAVSSALTVRHQTRD